MSNDSKINIAIVGLGFGAESICDLSMGRDYG